MERLAMAPPETARKIMKPKSNPEAAETVRIEDSPAVVHERLVRLSVVPVMIGNDEWVICPSCGFRELRSGWTGNEAQGGWECSCDECGQHLTIKDVTQDQLVRLFNKYGSTAGSDHAEAVDKIMNSAMDNLSVYLAENNVCPRDAMGYCVMIVTQHLSAYGLRRAMGMKRRERESRSLPNAEVSHGDSEKRS